MRENLLTIKEPCEVSFIRITSSEFLRSGIRVRLQFEMDIDADLAKTLPTDVSQQYERAMAAAGEKAKYRDKVTMTREYGAAIYSLMDVNGELNFGDGVGFAVTAAIVLTPTARFATGAATLVWTVEVTLDREQWARLYDMFGVNLALTVEPCAEPVEDSAETEELDLGVKGDSKAVTGVRVGRKAK